MSSLQTNTVTAVAPQPATTTPQTTQPASAVDSSVESFERLRSAIQSAATWLNDYQSLDPESVCIRKWKLPQDTRPSIEVIKLLPDHQKPHLPAGHIWHKDGNNLMILRHRATPSQIFQIYLFGPDHNQTTRDSRIQYIVSERNMPIHGFANAKKEGFSKDLRDEYPMSLESYKKNKETFWRGHIIDYQDTLGLTTDLGISTRLAQNYKPEPEGTWARNLRADLVEKTRDVRGSYSELQFYDFDLVRTDGGIPIPNSIFMETFDYSSKGRVKGYDVPKSHACHHWEKTGKNFCKNSLQLLENGDTFPALVVTKDQLPEHRSIITMQDFPAEYGSWTSKMGYQIRRIAELEFNAASYKLQYCLFGQAHKAPIHTLQFWLGRAVSLATAIDTAYQSKVPPFQLHLTNAVAASFSEQPALQKLVEKLMLISSNVLKAVSVPKQIEAASTHLESDAATDAQETVLQEEDTAHQAPENQIEEAPPSAALALNPVSITCKGTSTQTSSINSLMDRLTPIMQEGSPIILTHLTTGLAKQILPRIRTFANGSPTKVLERVEVSSPCFKNGVTKLVTASFGNNVRVV